MPRDLFAETTAPRDLFAEKGIDPFSKKPIDNTGERALKNLPSDIKNIGQSTIDMVSHPIDTAQGLLNVANGGIQSLPVVGQDLVDANLSGQDNRQAYRDFAQPLKDTVLHPLESFAEHPATTLLNLQGLTAGVQGLARMKPISATLDMAASLPIRTARGIGYSIGEIGTHTGGETIRDAARAGLVGGDKQQALIDFLREKKPLSEIVRIAEKGKAGLLDKQKTAYTNAIDEVFKDKTQLNYDPIKKALSEARTIGTYKGHTVKPSAINIANQLKPIIDEWSGTDIPHGDPIFDLSSNQWHQPMKAGFDPAKSHTIEGLDALKKRVGDLYDSVDEGTPEKSVLNKVYGSISKAIADQNPKYKNIMETDVNFRNDINELNKELSLSQNTTDNTTLRKLLSVPRNNANTNYGGRVALAKLLEDNGATNLMSMLNGAALSSVKPRGLGGVVGSGTTGASLYALAHGNLGSAAALAALTASQSPRFMGEAALKAGQTARMINKAAGATVGKVVNPVINKLKNPIDRKALIGILYQNQQEHK